MLRLLGVAFVVSIVYAQPDLHAWDCRRPTNPCVTGQGTCGTTAAGVCTCTGSYQNYDCGDDSSSDEAGNPCSCVNGGICKNDQTTCVCPETHYGSTCDQETIQGSCAVSDKIMVNVNIPNIANIDVYQPDTRDTCTLATPTTTGGNIPTEWEGKSQEISVPTDVSCGTATPRSDSAGVVTEHCVVLIIRHQSSFLTTLDAKATFCCTTAGQFSKAVVYLTASDLLREKTVNQPAVSDGLVTASMTEADGTTPIANNAVKNIGDPVYLVFKLAADADYTAIEAVQCRATSYDPEPAGAGAGATDTLEKFIEASCPTQRAIVKGTERGSNGEVIIHTEVVKFDGSDKVYYSCDMKLCTSSARCDGVVCVSGETYYGRKKRDASSPSSSTTQRTLTTVITVRDPLVTSGVKEVIKDGVAESSRVNVTAILIGLGVVVLVLLAMSLVLGVWLINRRASTLDKKFQGKSPELS